MKCENCKEPATIHISLARQYACYEERHLCENHAQEFIYQWPPSEAAGNVPQADAEIHLDVSRVIISERHDQQVIMFREVNGTRNFPLVCGIFEATSIDRRLKGMTAPRPLTHDVLADAISALGGDLQDVVIHELRDHTYYAKLRIVQRSDLDSVSDRLVEIDVRPSDAVALAVTCAVPIFVAANVMDMVCGPS